MTIEPDSRHAVQLGLAREVLHSFGELRMAARGASMVPSIFPGDVLTIRRLNAKEIACGDVALCVRNDRFFVHRVVGRSSDSSGVHWITRGDALTKDDQPVCESEVLGRVILAERDEKRWTPGRPAKLTRWAGWGVRRSGIALRLLLSWHSRRRLSSRSLFPATRFNVKGSSKC